MDHDPAKVAALRAALAEKRRRQQDYLSKRINLNAGEVHDLNRGILEDEQFLRDLGVSDA